MQEVTLVDRCHVLAAENAHFEFLSLGVTRGELGAGSFEIFQRLVDDCIGINLLGYLGWR